MTVPRSLAVRTHDEIMLAKYEDEIKHFRSVDTTTAKLSLPELVKERDKYKLAVALARRGGRLGSIQFVFGGGRK